MTQFQRIAFVGNSLPRRCGIATFTTHLRNAVASLRPGLETCIVAMTDNGHAYDYPPGVRLEIKEDKIEDYAHAADVLNRGRYDVVSLQHEFGIFGGEAGEHVLMLLNRLTMPVVTTLHTVLSQPSRVQMAVTGRIVDISSGLVVMSEKERDVLQKVYDLPARKIDVIPHGIPDIAFAEPEEAKASLGFEGRAVILTFGLLSPNKGIEYVIDAMPTILRSRPDAVYVVLGATHPNLIREKGEAYRESLVARAHELGVRDHVAFLDQFVDQTTCSASSRCAMFTSRPI
jgi:glycosyltransferase involved in cell wall biosynthesis